MEEQFVRRGLFFSKHVGLIHLAGLRVLKHFPEKNFFHLYLIIFLLMFSLLFHLLSSFLFHRLSLLHLVSSLVLLLLSSCLLSIFSSLPFSLFHLLSSLPLSSLVSSLLFHLLLPSCLVSSSPVLSLFLCPSFSVPLCLCLCLSLCLRVMLCVVCCVVCVVVVVVCACGVVCVWCVFGVCVCVAVCCGTLKKCEKNLCTFKNASVCTFKTSPCPSFPSASMMSCLVSLSLFFFLTPIEPQNEEVQRGLCATTSCPNSQLRETKTQRCTTCTNWPCKGRTSCPPRAIDKRRL